MDVIFPAMNILGTIALVLASFPQVMLSFDFWKKDAWKWNKFVLSPPKAVGSPLIVTSPVLYWLGLALILIGSSCQLWLLLNRCHR